MGMKWDKGGGVLSHMEQSQNSLQEISEKLLKLETKSHAQKGLYYASAYENTNGTSCLLKL